MSSASLQPEPPPHQTPSGRAPRGSACLNCRRRKLRCDGARPICGQCVRTNRELDCEYTDGPNPSATQILEEDIARLEARIYELEHPESVTSSVTLHNPHVQIPQAPTSAASTSAVVLSTAHSSVPSASTIQHNPNVELPLHVVQMLVGCFLPHISQVGFFLHCPRFLQAMYSPDPEVRTAQLSPALVNAVYVWGAHFSMNEALFANKPVFLARAVREMSTALGHVPPYKITYTIQAEVLLASYFFSMGRFLEGRFHCSAAVALALSCRLNKIRALPDPGVPDLVDAAQFELTAPVDSVEEGERINAFWTVYILDKSWAVALGSASHINGGSGAQVDTPWPLSIDDYEYAGLLPGLRGSRTMQTFLADIPAIPLSGTSLIALRAKAAALFDRATRLSAQWTPNMANVDRYSAEFFVLDTGIDRFVASLLPVEGAATPHAMRELLVTHTLARVATIQLYANFKDAEGMQESKDLTAARAAAALLDSVNLAELGYVDPILAILWTAVCRVLIAPGGLLQFIEGQQVQLDAVLQKVLGALVVFSHTAPLMGQQAAKIQQEMHDATR